MLVFTRKRGERIVVSGPCVIEFLGQKGDDKGRIGVTADDGVQIDREEVAVRKGTWAAVLEVLGGKRAVSAA